MWIRPEIARRQNIVQSWSPCYAESAQFNEIMVCVSMYVMKCTISIKINIFHEISRLDKTENGHHLAYPVILAGHLTLPVRPQTRRASPCTCWPRLSCPVPHIERVHLSFLKRVLGVKNQKIENDFIYGLLGRYPMRTIRQCRILSCWLKIVSGKKSRYVNVLYHAALSRIKENDSYDWVSDVKQLLCSICFGDVWYNLGVIDQTGCLSVIKQRLFDIFKQSWSARMVESPRARFLHMSLTSICSTDY